MAPTTAARISVLCLSVGALNIRNLLRPAEKWQSKDCLLRWLKRRRHGENANGIIGAVLVQLKAHLTNRHADLTVPQREL